MNAQNWNVYRVPFLAEKRWMTQDKSKPIELAASIKFSAELSAEECVAKLRKRFDPIRYEYRREEKDIRILNPGSIHW